MRFEMSQRFATAPIQLAKSTHGLLRREVLWFDALTVSRIAQAARLLSLWMIVIGVGVSAFTFNWIIEYNPELNFFPEFSGRVIYLSDVFLFAGVTLWMASWRLSSRQPLRYGPRYVFAPLFALTALTILSVIWADDAAIAGYSALRRVILLAMYVALVNESRRVFVPVVVVLVGVGLLHSAVALAQVFREAAVGLSFLGEISEEAIGYQSIGVSRAYGLGFNPNPIGLLLATVSVLACGIFLLKQGGGWQIKAASLLAFAIVFAGLVATGSRSALIGWLLAFAVVTALAWLWKLRGRKATILSAGAALSLALLIWWVLPSLVGAERHSTPSKIVTSPITNASDVLETTRVSPAKVANDLNDRVRDVKLSLPTIRDNFLTGVGAGNYPQALKNRLAPDSSKTLFTPVHNVLMLTQAELGIVGGISWAVIMLAPLIWIFSNQKYRKLEPRSLIWLGALLVILFESIFDFTPWATQDGRVLMMTVLGLWAGAIASFTKPDAAEVNNG